MKIIVGQHKLEIVKEPVNEREIDISKCEFEFDEAITSEYVKEAYFTLEGNTYKQIIQNDECDIPSEVLAKKGTVEIGVVAFLVEDEEEIKRYNPSPAYFNTWVGSLKDNAENSEPVTPTDKEQMEQALQDGLNDIDDKLGEVDDKMLVVDGKIEDIDTAITQTNNLNIDVSDKVGKNVTVTLTKKDATTKVVTLSDGTSLMFNWSGTSLGIKTDEDEEYTYVDLQGIQGPVGPMGAPFTIKKTYATIQLMIADYDNMNVGDYVMIASTVEVEDNAKLYVKGDSQWIFITDFSGATGIKGETGATPIIRIGTVTSGSTPSVTISGTAEEPVFNFVLQPGEKGEKGDTGSKGDTGNGIASIVKTASAGLIDTYTITFTNGSTTTFNVTNGQDGDVTQEYVDEENERLRSVFNVLPKVSDSGESVTLENTGDTMLYKMDLKGNTSQEVVSGEVGLEVEDTSIYVDDVNEDKENYITLKGNTYQETTTGKNLLNCNDFVASTVNGITFTPIFNENGTLAYINANGTSTGIIWKSLGNLTYDADTYTFYANSSDNNLRLYQDYPVSFVTTSQTVTFNESVTKQVYLNVESGKTLNNAKIYPMVAKASSISNYEPYTNGASPNPDYPQEVEVVTGNNSITIEGKNIIGELETGNIDENTGQNIANDYRKRSNYINVQSNTSYTLSCSTNNIWLIFHYYDANKTFISSVATYSSTGYISNITPNNCKFLRVVIGNTASLTATDIQLEKGNQATTYEAYQGQDYTVNLGSIELCKIGTYQDRIYKSLVDGNWYLRKEIGKVVLNGTQIINQVNIDATNTTRVKYQNIAKNFYTGGFCNILTLIPNVWSTDVEGVYQEAWNDTFAFRINKSTIGTTITEVNDYLSNNNLIFYGALRTPTETQITDTTLISQLNALYNATIYSTTHINTETSNLLPYIDLKYNVVTASPSPDRASEVEVVKGNNTITISNENGTKTQTYNITLGNLELCKIGNYQDYFYKDNGNWYKYGAIGKTTDVVGSTSITINDMINNGGMYSLYGGTLSGKTITYDSALLRQNTIYYPLSTPTTTQITDQLLVSQLDELQKAMSYYDKTLITQTNADKPFILDVIGIRDLQDIFNI